jgi:hypothetical protein
MNFLSNIKLNAEKINFVETACYLRDLHLKKKGKIISDFPPINGIEIELEFDKTLGYFLYRTSQIVFCEKLTEYQSDYYGIIHPFVIQIEDKKYYISKGVNSVKHNLKSMTLSGKISNIESTDFDIKKYYFRAIFPLNLFAKAPLQYFLGRGILNGESVKSAGYIDLEISKNKIGFYDYKINDKEYLLIDCKTKTDIESFNNFFEIIIYNFALISGFLLRDSVTFLKFENPDFSNIQGFSFKNSQGSVISSYELFNPYDYKIYYNSENRIFFPIEIFSNLCELTFNSNPLLRAIRNLTQSRNLPTEIQTAVFYITLETTKTIILKNNAEVNKPNSPFKESKKFRSTLRQLKKHINEIEDNDFNGQNEGKQIIINKLNNLNSIPNANGFLEVFKIMEIPLSDYDKYCLDQRNFFLHGNKPITKENEDFELFKISLNTHFITCALILKYAGYQGKLKNYLKYQDLVNQTNSIDQPLFRKI